MRVHHLSIFAPEPVGGGRRVRYGGGNRSGVAGRRRSQLRVLTGAEGNGMFPVAAIAGAGWLFLLVVLLIAPPSPGPHEGGGQGEGRAPHEGSSRGRDRTRRPEAGPEAGTVPPAVISLLARRLDRLGFGATLVD